MFKNRTLFIVGAGASFEFDLPVGVQLAEIISERLSYRRDGDGNIKFSDRELLHQFQRVDQTNSNRYLEAFQIISSGARLSNSIDDFLDVHQANPFVNHVGKAAIVKSILNAERHSKLHYDRSNAYNRLDMAKVHDTWLVKFMRMFGRGVPLENVEKEIQNVSFIVFNYDRCLEQFLLHALQYLYSIGEQRASEILAKINIIHPYGDVGRLPTALGGSGVGFGGAHHRSLDAEDVVSLAKRIRTYTEVQEGEARENIDAAIQDAHTLVFLGFGFHEQNLRLLWPGKQNLTGKRIYATALGMSDSDVGVTRGRLLQFFEPRSVVAVRLQLDKSIHSDMTCSKLFDYYTQSLPN